MLKYIISKTILYSAKPYPSPFSQFEWFCCAIKHCMIVFHINNKTTITCVHKWWKVFLHLIINPARLRLWIPENTNPFFSKLLVQKYLYFFIGIDELRACFKTHKCIMLPQSNMKAWITDITFTIIWFLNMN